MIIAYFRCRAICTSSTRDNLKSLLLAHSVDSCFSQTSMVLYHEGDEQMSKQTSVVCKTLQFIFIVTCSHNMLLKCFYYIHGVVVSTVDVGSLDVVVAPMVVVTSVVVGASVVSIVVVVSSVVDVITVSAHRKLQR